MNGELSFLLVLAACSFGAGFAAQSLQRLGSPGSFWPEAGTGFAWVCALVSALLGSAKVSPWYGALLALVAPAWLAAFLARRIFLGDRSVFLTDIDTGRRRLDAWFASTGVSAWVSASLGLLALLQLTKF